MTCATCTHWSPKQAKDMAKHRMCPCALGKPWTFFGPEHLCAKHKEAAPEIVHGRATWLAQQPASSNVQRKHGK